MIKKHYGTKEDYKLAEQLRDIGFPQEITPGSDRYFVISKCKEGWTVIMQMTQIKNYSNYIKVPTLEKVLEELGDRFVSLFKEAKCWSAQTDEIETKGSTSLEAVTKLYIELNKKK